MRKQNFALWVILLVACGGISMSLALLFRWNRPLGPSLGLPTLTPSTTSRSTVAAVQATSNIKTPASSTAIVSTDVPDLEVVATPLPFPTATLQPLCNGPATMTILGIGSDQRGTSYLYGLADSIYVAYIDFRIPKVMVIDFPRDLWVEIPGIADHHGITHGKLNQAYLFGNPGMGYYDGPGEGPGLLARTLDHNFGLRVDHYVAVDMQTFVKVIDAVGGVDIKVDSPIDLNYGITPPNPKFYLSEGTHHLGGEIALRLVTNRIPTTFTRMQYQRLVMAALREKLLSPAIIPQVPGLVTRFLSSIRTDLSLSDFKSLICLFQAVPKENIQVDSIPEEMFTAKATYDQYRKLTTFIYEADFEALKVVVADFMNGIWPFPEK